MSLSKERTELAAVLHMATRQLSKNRVTAHRPVCYLPGNAGRIDAVEQWIFEHPQQLRDVDLFQVLALGPASGWERAVMGGVGIVTPFIGPGVRQLVNAGLARNIRCNLSQVPRLFEGRWRPEVAFAHTSPPDRQGRVTLGLNAGIDIAAVRQARFKVAVVNSNMPRWHIDSYDDPASGQRVDVGCAMNLADFDRVVRIDAPLVVHAQRTTQPECAEQIHIIAGSIVDLLRRDADAANPTQLPHTIQLGIGKIADAVAVTLAQRGASVRGVWSEMFSDGVLDLYRAGLIRHTNGPLLRDHIVVGFVMGSLGLYEAMHENPDFAVVPQAIVNDPAFIRHNDSMASINSALAVSLAGEVASATIHNHYYSDVGGQFDFALGASWARKGTAIIGLPSVVRLRDGTQDSRIVSSHAEGSHHTIGADLPVVVVTEQGVADLRTLNDTERVAAMLEVAHPQWRTLLAKQARTLPSMQGVGVIPARLVALQDGRTAVLRPAGESDIAAISSYIGRMNPDDRFTRYMGSISVQALTSAERLSRLYHDTLDYQQHAAFIVEIEGEIIGVAHAFRMAEWGTYEVSFSRRGDVSGQGIGTQLMQMLIEWGVTVGAEKFYATTYRSKNPRMRALFDRFGFAAHADADDFESVTYTARVQDLARVRRAPVRSDAAAARSVPPSQRAEDSAAVSGPD